MSFLAARNFRFIVGIWAQLRQICSYAFLPARTKTIANTCEAGSDQAAELEWILDSGAPSHAVGDKLLLSRLLGFTAATYKTRGGRVLFAAGVGTISCANFLLSDVLYVPDLRNRVVLVSVQQLAERGYLVMFAGGQCSVTDRSSGEIVGKGRLHDEDGLYHLEFLEIPTDTPRACVTAAP